MRSWDNFPVLGEEMLEVYRAEVSEVEKTKFEEWLGIKTQDIRLEEVRKEEEVAEGKAEI